MPLQERSCVYEKLLECEELAKGAKRGVHSAKEPPVNRLNDVSAPGNAAKWVGITCHCAGQHPAAIQHMMWIHDVLDKGGHLRRS
jgi:hypothetical protein